MSKNLDFETYFVNDTNLAFLKLYKETRLDFGWYMGTKELKHTNEKRYINVSTIHSILPDVPLKICKHGFHYSLDLNSPYFVYPYNRLYFVACWGTPYTSNFYSNKSRARSRAYLKEIVLSNQIVPFINYCYSLCCTDLIYAIVKTENIKNHPNQIERFALLKWLNGDFYYLITHPKFEDFIYETMKIVDAKHEFLSKLEPRPRRRNKKGNSNGL